MAENKKQERYALLKVKLSKALRYEFWFEACMIEYAIIEDRTSSILAHAGVCQNAYDSSKKLSNKLNSIEHCIGKAHPIISKKVSADLIAKLRAWKDRRNDLVHRACTLYSETEAREIAEAGKKLVDELSNAAQRVSNLAKKLSSEKE